MMAQTEASTTPQADRADDEEGLRKRLLRRVAIAAAVVVVLLGGLVLFEAMTVPRENPQQESARIEPVPRPIVDKPAVEDEVVEQVERKETDKPAENAVATVEPEAEPELTEAPHRVERPLTVPARAHKAMIRPAEPVTAAPTAEPVKEATAAPARAARQPVPPASRPIATAVESVRQFLVQAGVFNNIANAEELRAKIEAAGIPARIEARVQIGPFAGRQEAEQAREKLKSLGLDPGLIVAARK
jgi:cell division protein FtsN